MDGWEGEGKRRQRGEKRKKSNEKTPHAANSERDAQKRVGETKCIVRRFLSRRAKVLRQERL